MTDTLSNTLTPVICNKHTLTHIHSESSRAARVVRVWTESADVRKEKLESRAEVKRLQALKENDMEAYAKLVQETKNDR